MGFDMAFGLRDPIDPSYGYISAKIVDFYYENSTDGSTVRIKDRMELPLDTCNNTGFNYSDKAQVTAYGLDSMYCLSNKDFHL